MDGRICDRVNIMNRRWLLPPAFIVVIVACFGSLHAQERKQLRKPAFRPVFAGNINILADSPPVANTRTA